MARLHWSKSHAKEAKCVHFFTEILKAMLLFMSTLTSSLGNIILRRLTSFVTHYPEFQDHQWIFFWTGFCLHWLSVLSLYTGRELDSWLISFVMITGSGALRFLFRRRYDWCLVTDNNTYFGPYDQLILHNKIISCSFDDKGLTIIIWRNGQ